MVSNIVKEWSHNNGRIIKDKGHSDVQKGMWYVTEVADSISVERIALYHHIIYAFF